MICYCTGEPIPLDMDAVHKHQQRLDQRTKGRGGGGGGKDEQHQPNAGDGRILGSPSSKEPEPEQQGPEGKCTAYCLDGLHLLKSDTKLDWLCID